MNTAERIDILRRHGLPTAAIAATLGIDHAAVTGFVADPSNVPSGLLTFDPGTDTLDVGAAHLTANGSPVGGGGLAEQGVSLTAGPNIFQAQHVFDLGGPATFFLDPQLTAVVADGETFAVDGILADLVRIETSADAGLWKSITTGAWYDDTPYAGGSLPYRGWGIPGVTARYVRITVQVSDAISFEAYAGANHPTATFDIAVTYVGGSGGVPAVVTPFSPQVFEVTNLVIPAGTDWSTAPHVIGSTDVPVDSSVLISLYIESAGDPAPDSVALVVRAAGSNVLSAAVDVGITWSANSQFISVPGNIGQDQAVPPTAHALALALMTAGPTTADITVVRARAAFLLI